MASTNIVHISRDNFGKEVKDATMPVLVDFWAEWCGPCRAIAPVLDEIADANVGKLKIAKVNVDENQELAAQFQIMNIPTLLIFKNGEVKDQIVGALRKKDLEAKLATHIG